MFSSQQLYCFIMVFHILGQVLLPHIGKIDFLRLLHKHGKILFNLIDNVPDADQLVIVILFRLALPYHINVELLQDVKVLLLVDPVFFGHLHESLCVEKIFEGHTLLPVSQIFDGSLTARPSLKN